MKQTKQIFALIVWLAFLSTTTTKAGGTYYMTVGQTKTLSFSTSRVIKSASWYSASPSIVEVTSYGGTYAQIKAVKSFSSYVIVRCDYYYWITSGTYRYLAAGFEDFDIYVNPVSPTNISIPSSLTINIDNYSTLSPILTPSNAETTLTWLSDDTSVATVSSSGEIHAVSPGTTNITVRTSNSLSSTCHITVPEPSFILQAVNPTNNALNINTNTTISTEFSLPIFQGSKYAEISLLNMNTGLQTSGSTYIGGSKLVFIPTQVLDPNTNYKFTIPSGSIKNQWGNEYSTAVEINFKTTVTTSTVDVQSMVVQCKSGGESVTALANVQRITFSGTIMRVIKKDATQSDYSLASVQKILFGLRNDPTAIVTTEKPRVRAYPNPATDILFVDGIDRAENVHLYSLTGIELAVKSTLLYNSLQLYVSALPQGFYLLQVNNQTIKFQKR